ncbi:hypothetical protein AXF42_Ash021099 [Apostasia shenzhenica]|uniref:Uncharacterized protein n=1 Tax=Apostasia shenzhenica TaxID=1088818 RepID=A0A2I0A3F5_9ASPA|nr:hypothetical protein AXF42_Ash021099 [Apostasia shenzhenica]
MEKYAAIYIIWEYKLLIYLSDLLVLNALSHFLMTELPLPLESSFPFFPFSDGRCGGGESLL